MVIIKVFQHGAFLVGDEKDVDSRNTDDEINYHDSAAIRAHCFQEEQQDPENYNDIHKKKRMPTITIVGFPFGCWCVEQKGR